MNRTRKNLKRLLTVAPAVAMTLVSMVLTLAVVVMWLGQSMPWQVALVVGLGLDGGWLSTLAYERRLAAQGDHSRPVTAVGWSFGVLATAVLVAHALLAEASAGAWLAVAWLPLAAKALWLVHSLWERTALTAGALDKISTIQQEARDEAAVARARLQADATTEETRLTAVTEAGARVAKVQAATAAALSEAWAVLEKARLDDKSAAALASVTGRVTPGSQPMWELPVWGPVEPLPALPALDAPALSDDELDSIIGQILASQTPPPSYREAASRFRAAGHSASETRLRASWKRLTADGATG
ncbi:protein spdB [Actinacidiphila acidipaludis]|uniref:Protein spdB n=1 Tax=Actinacidiphila acidipaludis TaxID=2873382 RepID=A0ABS7Q0Y5_9ACTN|nr:protein spdB [Streptomyces acidipaludis]MBY8876805.1 protein spdB [Streptomyces acidipaludis]